MAVPELTRLLAIEGVRRVIITTPEPKRYRGVSLDPIAQVRHRDELPDGACASCAGSNGVTVLIHDDRCAAEERRLRRRGTLPQPTSRVWINPRVCEGCGDCGEKSSCLSVVPVETEFGRKTEIHQGSCNDDLSCLRRRLPLVRDRDPRPGSPAQGPTRRASSSEPPVDLVRTRDRRTPDDLLVRMPGIGGTGVVTVSRILQMAAHLDGLYAAGLDQTGLAQKGGPVISDVRIAARPIDAAVKASAGAVDLLLGLDLLGVASDENLAVADPGRTVAVVNTAGVATAANGAGPVDPLPQGHGPHRPSHQIRPRTSTSTPSGSPSDSSATTCQPTWSCSARHTSTAVCPSRPAPSKRRSASTGQGPRRTGAHSAGGGRR